MSSDQNAGVAMRRIVNSVSSMRAMCQDSARDIAGLRDTYQRSETAADKAARAEADKFAPASAYVSDLCAKLEEVFPERRKVLPSVDWPNIPQTLVAASQLWCDLSPAVETRVSDVVAARKAWEAKVFRSKKKMPRVEDGINRDLALLQRILKMLPDLRDGYVADAKAGRAGSRQKLNADIAAADASLTDQLTQARRTLMSLTAGLPLSARDWSDQGWGPYEPSPAMSSLLRLGDFEPSLPSGADVSKVPALLDFPFVSGLSIQARVQHRAAALELARSVITRILFSVAPGRARFVFVDPVSLGQSVAEFRHLSDYDQFIVDLKTWTSERDIERRLGELSDHLEVVISKYLKGQFSSIDEYNRHAGEVAEPYQILVVYDYPEAFSDRAAKTLLSLIENGPRCGVHTIVVSDPDREQPRDLPLERLLHSTQRVSFVGAPGSEGSRARVVLADPVGAVDMELLADKAPPLSFDEQSRPTTQFARALEAVGQGARQGTDGPVTLDRLLPVLNRQMLTGRQPNVPQLAAGAGGIELEDESSWWQASTATGACAPIGRAGAQDVASLYLSSTEIAGGGIVVGLPRSGKSTALHAAITTASLIYSPDELELYLIDSKHGVEFKAYEDLPHARMVSIRSEREFSVAVLKSLDAEIGRRAKLMKARTAGIANLTEYRKATGEVLPRILLVMDEFHEIFEEDDAIGQAAFAAFSNIVKQGSFAGIHVIVASQTLGAMPAMDRGTLALLPIRVAFMCNEVDGDFVMGDTNREVRALSTQGAGILNPLKGDAAHNKPFKGTYIPPDERSKLLQRLSAKARAQGFTRRPRVFDGDGHALRPDSGVIAWGTPEKPYIPLGEPLDLSTSAGVTLRRGRGANVLLLGASEADESVDTSALGALHSIITGAAHQKMEVTVADLGGDSDTPEGYATLEQLAAAVGARYLRSRSALGSLAALAEEVERRQKDEDYHAQGRLLVLAGVQRAGDLAPHDPYASTSLSFDDDAPAPPPAPGTSLAAILRDGPDVGVHTVVAVDLLNNFQRRLGQEALQEFDTRAVVSNALAADVTAVTETYKEAAVTRNQILVADRNRGRSQRVRAYSPLTLPVRQ